MEPLGNIQADDGLPNCGFCGAASTPRHSARKSAPWLLDYRAIYCIGPDSSAPRLSGLATYDEGAPVNYVPPDLHQTASDSGPGQLSSMIRVRGIRPPKKKLDDSARSAYAWGFHFHGSCWKLLEQASAPRPVDVRVLWRMLLSVPYFGDIPRWGHNTGGAYIDRRGRPGDGRHYFSPDLLWGPRRYCCPFMVPEIREKLGHLDARRNDGDNPPSEEFPPIAPAGGACAALDPFSRLPVELRELILNFVEDEDVLSLRLASRGIAAISLSQQFFRSRFWPGRELGVLFDGFLLEATDRAVIDWKQFYRWSKSRFKQDNVRLPEYKRYYMWWQMIRPLRQAMDDVARLGELKGGVARIEEPDVGPSYELVKIRVINNNCRKYDKWQAEVTLPPMIKAMHVSMINFFSEQYITGLVFSTEQGEDIEIGYIFRGHEQPILVEAGLVGFDVTLDKCGFVSIEPCTQQSMQSEKRGWWVNGFHSRSIRSYGGFVRRLQATFDGFKLLSLGVYAS